MDGRCVTPGSRTHVSQLRWAAILRELDGRPGLGDRVPEHLLHEFGVHLIDIRAGLERRLIVGWGRSHAAVL